MFDFITNSTQTAIALHEVFQNTVVSLLCGMGVAALHMVRNKYSKSFVVALALLPAMVQIVIMLVNGNLGAGVAVSGAFSLVRFRSVPGNAKDIGSIFLAMAIGLATGMGYNVYAVVFLVLIGAANILLMFSNFGNEKPGARIMRITIPENLDYENLFDDLFDEYAERVELDRVKTTNMGSLYELTYSIQLRGSSVPKSFVDAIRCRNGNLNIIISRPASSKDEL